MNKYILIFFVAFNIQAQELHTCLEYMTTNDPTAKFILWNDSDGNGTYIKQWQSTIPKPTIEEALSNWTNAASWKSNQVAEVNSEIANWKNTPVTGDTLKDAFTALIICINKRLPATNKITASEFKAELKNQILKGN